MCFFFSFPASPELSLWCRLTPPHRCALGHGTRWCRTRWWCTRWCCTLPWVFLGCAIPRGCRAEGQVGCDPPPGALTAPGAQALPRAHCPHLCRSHWRVPMAPNPSGTSSRGGSQGARQLWRAVSSRRGKGSWRWPGVPAPRGGPHRSIPTRTNSRASPCPPRLSPLLNYLANGKCFGSPSKPRLAPVATAEPWGSSGAPGPFAIAASPRQGQPLCVFVPPPRPKHLETFL